MFVGEFVAKLVLVFFFRKQQQQTNFQLAYELQLMGSGCLEHEFEKNDEKKCYVIALTLEAETQTAWDKFANPKRTLLTAFNRRSSFRYLY